LLNLDGKLWLGVDRAGNASGAGEGRGILIGQQAEETAWLVPPGIGGGSCLGTYGRESTLRNEKVGQGPVVSF